MLSRLLLQLPQHQLVAVVFVVLLNLGIKFLSDLWNPPIHAYMLVAADNTFSTGLVLVFSIARSGINDTSKFVQIINLDRQLSS